MKLTILLVIFVFGFIFHNDGRSLWHPTYVKVMGKRAVADVESVYGKRARATLQPLFEKAGVAYPPDDMTFLAIKDTGQLEVWVNQGDVKTYITSYQIEAQSGRAGPKLLEGDRQVPEGIYRISGLNPNSSYHLSMKLNYPNEFDLIHAKAEGRKNPGSNIFIHGKAVSVGCLAMGDKTIEELFILVYDVGRTKTNVVIAPTDPRKAALKRVPGIPWSDALYTNIEQSFSDYIR